MAKYFAMEPSELERIIALHNNLEVLKAEASRKDRQELTAIIKSETEDSGSLFYVDNGEAHIPIVGELSEQPSFSATLLGEDQTTYGSIIENIAKAEKDPLVEKIIFDIDSPGGTVDGVDQTAMAIRLSEKPNEARVHNFAASAAYWLASQADRIVAMTPSAEIGSIGVVIEAFDFSKADEKRGIQRVVITSTEAPDKRTDIATSEGQKKIRSRLDDIHNVFVKRVAEGRDVDGDTVNSDFGRGGVLIAEKALNAGMIDAIIDGADMIKRSDAQDTAALIEKDDAETHVAEPAQGAGKNNEEVIPMTKDQLKADNPGLYNEIFEAGVKEERDRVQAHLTLGKQSGAMEAAVEHIKAGDSLTQAISAEYMSAGMNKNDLEARTEDEAQTIETETEVQKDPVAKAKEKAAEVIALKEGA